MNTQIVDTPTLHAVVISREYGSGGGELARRLATQWGWRLLDHQVVEMVARTLGMSQCEAEGFDEQDESFVTHLLEAMAYEAPESSPVLLDQDLHAYREAVRRMLLAAASTGQVVIVGRGAEGLFVERRDVLRVRVVAPLSQRIAYVMRREGIDQEAARARLEHKDRERERDLRAQYPSFIHDLALYDLVINTGQLTVPSAVGLVQCAAACKESLLSLSEDEVGPGAGLAPYATQPHDLPTPSRAGCQEEISS